jgi:UDP-N-acetylglucosamine--N-acetylmuramyl-(pentapeptide) pyrophosphoryl-undecaprenol N-acetylglucosamine transferase
LCYPHIWVYSLLWSSEAIMNKKNIAFVWGWSGGHIQPIASLLDYAKQYTNISNQSKRYRFGQSWWLEETYADRYEEVTFLPIYTWKLRRYWTMQSTRENIRDMFFIVAWFFQSVWKLKKNKIDVIFCKWWFVCPPVAYAWRLLCIPIFVHESDTHVWLANRLVLPVARTVFTGFWWLMDGERVVGQILSPTIIDETDYILEWIDNSKTTILVMWGSQWAAVLFDTVSTIIQELPRNLQFVFVLGTKNSESDYAIQWQVWTVEFVSQEDMWYLYGSSDIAITRGSASALQEQQYFGIKKAIVPLPHTWGDHQTVNAKWYEATYNDVWIPQDDSLKDGLTNFIKSYSSYKKVSRKPSVDELCSASIVIWEELMA